MKYDEKRPRDEKVKGLLTGLGNVHSGVTFDPSVPILSILASFEGV